MFHTHVFYTRVRHACSSCIIFWKLLLVTVRECSSKPGSHSSWFKGDLLHSDKIFPTLRTIDIAVYLWKLWIKLKVNKWLVVWAGFLLKGLSCYLRLFAPSCAHTIVHPASLEPSNFWVTYDIFKAVPPVSKVEQSRSQYIAKPILLQSWNILTKRRKMSAILNCGYAFKVYNLVHPKFYLDNYRLFQSLKLR